MTAGDKAAATIRFLLLVVVLNLVRYILGGAVESALIMERLGNAMSESADYFNTAFGTWDWVTSFGYNFVMWAVATWVFHLLRPQVYGNDVVASVKVFSIMWLMFAAISAIYMNHYSHPKDFYVLNILDGVIAFGFVALANGLVYRKIMGRWATPGPLVTDPALAGLDGR